MIRKLFFVVTLSVLALTIQAQKNFTYTPEKPKAGDVIKITYEPSGDLANVTGKLVGTAYISGKGRKAEDLVLTRSGKKYTATIQTDTAATFVQLGFFIEKKTDNNFNEGYTIHIYDGDKPRKGSYFALANFHQFYAEGVGVEKSTEKAAAAVEKEMALYPDQKRMASFFYYRLLSLLKKDGIPAMVQKDIEEAVKAGLNKEEDYSYLESLYNIAKLPEQAKLMSNLKKEKFPNGKWVVGSYVNKFFAETDPTKKEEMFNTITKNVASDPAWKSYENSVPEFLANLANTYSKAKMWDAVKRSTAQMKDKLSVASIYNSIAWDLQGKNEDLAIAEEFSRFATEFTKAEIKNPTSKKPDYMTQTQWDKNRPYTYAMYADTYAMVLYRQGDYKKAFEFAKDAALNINEGKDADQNNTYALIAEKVLPPKELKPALEKFVKEGHSTAAVKDALKKLYVAEKSSEDGFDTYIDALGREMYLKMLEDLKKSMLNESAPTFALLDLNGNKVSLPELKGKVVILDFWATWCGPCKASFPGMQKMVNKFKDNPNVKFLFVDTWERGEGKEKNAADFIEKNKYTFHVLMDNDNSVVESYKVEGIPTKFVLDKEGKIRFKSVGFDGSDDKLISELTAMIEMAANEKTF